MTAGGLSLQQGVELFHHISSKTQYAFKGSLQKPASCQQWNTSVRVIHIQLWPLGARKGYQVPKTVSYPLQAISQAYCPVSPPNLFLSVWETRSFWTTAAMLGEFSMN